MTKQQHQPSVNYSKPHSSVGHVCASSCDHGHNPHDHNHEHKHQNATMQPPPAPHIYIPTGCGHHHGDKAHDGEKKRKLQYQQLEQHQPAHDPEDAKLFETLLGFFKKVVEMQPDEHSMIKGNFSCPQASYFNEKVNACRQGTNVALLNVHDHEPVFTKEERNYAIKQIAEEMKQYATPMSVSSQAPNKIVYGDLNDPEQQITYTFSDGKWNVTPGKNVNAVIIDPAGKVIEITPGPHIQEYGDGGNLIVEEVCKGHHEGHDHHHKAPSSEASGHGTKATENPHQQHVHSSSCNHG